MLLIQSCQLYSYIQTELKATEYRTVSPPLTYLYMYINLTYFSLYFFPSLSPPVFNSVIVSVFHHVTGTTC